MKHRAGYWLHSASSTTGKVWNFTTLKCLLSVLLSSCVWLVYRLWSLPKESCLSLVILQREVGYINFAVDTVKRYLVHFDDRMRHDNEGTESHLYLTLGLTLFYQNQTVCSPLECIRHSCFKYLQWSFLDLQRTKDLLLFKSTLPVQPMHSQVWGSFRKHSTTVCFILIC